MQNTSGLQCSDKKKSKSGNKHNSGDTLNGRQKKVRLRLRCGNKFLSKSLNNRICEKCCSTNDTINVKTYSVGTNSIGKRSYTEALFDEIVGI
ncbi:MAG: hypothetical protein A3H23_01350 [Planctomycetes bacterium RIFCSPLOWO2_12_FULL_40_19]|nr:MAG: hypothetical protein A3H23_01350 [Planctomycetes bacterium RIFCSPLOWO2_12_FULL_40_19]